MKCQINTFCDKEADTHFVHGWPAGCEEHWFFMLRLVLAASSGEIKFKITEEQYKWLS